MLLFLPSPMLSSAPSHLPSHSPVKPAFHFFPSVIYFPYRLLRQSSTEERKIHMTDNEKRAHDLAVASCLAIFDIKKEESISHGKNFEFDIYKEYINGYNKMLESLNRDFPNGK